MLRPGNAGSNTASDHIAVTDLALAQMPDADRQGPDAGLRRRRRCDPRLAGAPARLRATGSDLRVLGRVHHDRTVQAAILALPEPAWTPAVNADGGPRDGADVAELTGLLATSAPGGRGDAGDRAPRTSSPRRAAGFTDPTVGGFKRSPPTPASGSWLSSRPGTALTPGSRTGSAAEEHRPEPAALPTVGDQRTPGSSWP